MAPIWAVFGPQGWRFRVTARNDYEKAWNDSELGFASRRVGRAGACGRLLAPSGAVGSVRGAAGAMAWWREGGRVLVDGHFSARTSAALPPPPKNLVLARYGAVMLPGREICCYEWTENVNNQWRTKKESRQVTALKWGSDQILGRVVIPSNEFPFDES